MSVTVCLKQGCKVAKVCACVEGGEGGGGVSYQKQLFYPFRSKFDGLSNTSNVPWRTQADCSGQMTPTVDQAEAV